MQALPVVRRIAGLLAVEAGAVVLLAVVYAVYSAVATPENRVGAELTAACALLLGVCLALLARATAAARPWPRTPAVLLNLIALPVGYGLVQGHVWSAAVPVLGLALLTLGAYATPAARQALREQG